MNARIICDQDKLTGYLHKMREKGKRIVFTNGCFDILHAGHISYLKQARSFGDVLVVALNDDASVKRLKGPLRPLCALEDRMEVVAALRSVDVVTCFSEDTPLNLINAVLPDVLVKGGDYSRSSVVGAAEVEERGGRVEIVPLLEGRSTSKLIQKITEPGN